jgi:hypothetical protein
MSVEEDSGSKGRDSFLQSPEPPLLLLVVVPLVLLTLSRAIREDFPGFCLSDDMLSCLINECGSSIIGRPV